MSSRYKSPLNLSNNPFNTTREALFALLNSTLPNAFSYIIATSLTAIVSEKDALLLVSRLRDTCKRLKLTYNERYDPFKAPPTSFNLQYSLYISGEPLHDNRLIITTRILLNHILASAAKRLQIAWV
jgi:hypothetical protein